jgi:two-component system sensor histidine kinase CiaH
MPDGAAIPADDPAERQALASDEQLVRGVRRRLVLWSGGITLLILVILGSILFLAVQRSLAASGEAELDQRARQIIDAFDRPGPALGLREFGQDAAGTFAMLLGPNGRNVVGELRIPTGLPHDESADEARRSGHDVVATTNIGSTPVRILNRPVEANQGTFVIQIVQNRAAEQRTLLVTLAVLLVGGLVALLVATWFGAFYASRALVPIRQSLVNQRIALRRQREFAADASHELRTPLTVIRASAEHLLRNRDKRVQDVGDAVTDINAEVDHLTSLVEDLLLLARSDSGAVALAREPLDLGDVATAAASSLVKPATDRGVRVIVDPEPAAVSGDPARLRQLVMILVDNAIRHTPSGGEVRVAVRADDGVAFLAVDDDGPGVRPEDMARIFERFWRAPGAPQGGTGLGLAIARWIVERHGGQIQVVNRPEGGARFTARLPAGRAAAG